MSISRATVILTIDTFIVLVALPLALLTRDNFNPSRIVGLITPEMMGALAIVTIFVFFTLGTHRLLWRYSSGHVVLSIFKAAALIVLLFLPAAFMINRLENIPRSVPLMHFLFIVALMLLARLFYVEIVRRVRGRLSVSADVSAPVLVVGDGIDTFAPVCFLDSHPSGAGRIVGVLDDTVSAGRRIGPISVLGGVADLERVLARLAIQGQAPAQIVVVQSARLDMAAIERRVAACGIVDGARVCSMAEYLGVLQPAAAADGNPAAALLAEGVPRQTPGSFLSRVFDVAVSGTLLVVTGPLIALIALALLGPTGGNILFRQIRPGLGMRPFQIRKFATMREPMDRNGNILPDEERVFWLGRFLRRTRLDELLQLWNVLAGDMALIGPRPLLVKDLPPMDDADRNLRFSVRPGITGWAQVNGGHSLSPEEKLALDLWYIRHRSLALDLRIIWLTLVMVVRGERINHEAIRAARAGEMSAEPAASVAIRGPKARAA